MEPMVVRPTLKGRPNDSRTFQWTDRSVVFWWRLPTGQDFWWTGTPAFVCHSRSYTFRRWSPSGNPDEWFRPALQSQSVVSSVRSAEWPEVIVGQNPWTPLQDLASDDWIAFQSFHWLLSQVSPRLLVWHRFVPTKPTGRPGSQKLARWLGFSTQLELSG